MKWLERSLVLTGLLLLGAWGFWRLDAALYQRVAGRQLREESVVPGGRPLSLPGDRGGPPGPRAPRPSAPIGRIVIPRVGVSAVIAEGTSTATLRRAVGHISGTALPGTPGNVAIAGHRDGLFRPLRLIHPNDEIDVVTPGGRYRYRVDWTRVVGPKRVDVIAPTPGASLTLVTCYPFHWIGPAPDRFIVRATLIAGRS